MMPKAPAAKAESFPSLFRIYLVYSEVSSTYRDETISSTACFPASHLPDAAFASAGSERCSRQPRSGPASVRVLAWIPTLGSADEPCGLLKQLQELSHPERPPASAKPPASLRARSGFAEAGLNGGFQSEAVLSGVFLCYERKGWRG